MYQILDFLINPPKIVQCLTKEQKEKNIILLGLDFEVEMNGAYRIALDVVFNPIAVKRGPITRADYYIGSTGAEVTLDVANGQLLDYTEATVPHNNSQHDLALVFMRNLIKWVIVPPSLNETLIRDLQRKNVALFATCTWENSTKSGNVYVRPSDIRFFDLNGKPVNAIGSLIMRYKLWEKGIQIENCDGLSISFEERQS